MSKNKIGMRIGESVFCIVYLIFDLIAGMIFLKNGNNTLFLLYGIMTLILGIGDSFHLIPRVINHIKGENDKVKWWMGLGLMITSISMTIFYVILYYIWKMQYTNNVSNIITYIIWILAILRVAICLLPQNNWLNGGNKKMSLLRNGIFLILGLIEVVLFAMLGKVYGIVSAICILLSFLFYMPVTLYAKENPKIGMLMLPKTIMYIVLISLGLSII